MSLNMVLELDIRIVTIIIESNVSLESSRYYQRIIIKSFTSSAQQKIEHQSRYASVIILLTYFQMC